MSDTEQMVRLMEHAADLIGAELDRQETLAGKLTLDPGQARAARASALRVGATLALAEGVLRMVAASVSPEGRRIAAELVAGYADWAEKNNEIGMSPGELEAVARFIATGAS